MYLWLTVTIRDVPDNVKEALNQDAKEHGQSLQAFLLKLLKQQATFTRNRQLLTEIEHDLKKGGGADHDVPDSAVLLAQTHTQRDSDNTELSQQPSSGAS